MALQSAALAKGESHVYIHRSVLLLFVFICLVLMVGMNWAAAPGASWYRPFLLAVLVIVFAAWMQRHQANDDY